MIAKLGYFVPSSVLLNIYKSLILPNITINSLLEAMHPKKYIVNKIGLQEQVLCLIYFPDRKEHALSLFINAKILPIAFLYWEAVCKLKLDVQIITTEHHLSS